ncbi:hypothetical protein PCANC_04483 [Puccinia coronata f. sp. avenae]|uniref:Phospholipid scramblase n=1 Tax=Puccinia coronata f. sp. avenae TaxID=200324 RepID=A0A2N5VUM5_9BASI|nr:hypothetical protein PCANC_08763 [Puccinia coronata f. sp. avenae]PLW53697.1 hypothetical protein PCANC_04483 [Puccinia coronata f. sp. avenae]
MAIPSVSLIGRTHPRTSTGLLLIRNFGPRQRASYSPLPVRPTPKARKNRTQKRPPPPISLVLQPPNTVIPEVGRSAVFPWTEYSQTIPRATNVAGASWAGEVRKQQRPTKSLVVKVKEDKGSVIKRGENGALVDLLSQSSVVMVRQLEMLNLMVGYEQANRYKLVSPTGTLLGFLVEEEQGLGSTILRQLAGTHRPFKATLLDCEGSPILSIRRSFSLINSRIRVQLPNNHHTRFGAIGESQQEFHLWRRRYNLFINRSHHPDANPKEKEEEEEEQYEQFARIDAGFLAWDFHALDREGQVSASVSKNLTGIAREIFTDTGQYVVRFDAVDVPNIPLPHPTVSSKGLSLDQRAVILATAISIDFDYFSRSHRGGLFSPFWFGGGSSSDGDF